MNALTDGVILFAVISMLLAVAAFLGDCDNRYHFFR
jgi:hypothetical protein